MSKHLCHPGLFVAIKAIRTCFKYLLKTYESPERMHDLFIQYIWRHLEPSKLQKTIQFNLAEVVYDKLLSVNMHKKAAAQ